MVIPHFRDESAYLLVQANEIHGEYNQMILLARAVQELDINKISTSFSGSGLNGCQVLP